MPSLKDLKNRIESVKNTRKITKAMQMVAAAKLRRAQDTAEAARPYASRFNSVLGSLAISAKDSDSAPKLLKGTGRDSTHLLLVMTAERATQQNNVETTAEIAVHGDDFDLGTASITK